MPELTAAPGRSCGECTACCQIFSEPQPGCCAYMQGHGDEELRPDRFGIMTMMGQIPVGTRAATVIDLYETHRGALEQPRVQQFIEGHTDAGSIVITRKRLAGSSMSYEIYGVMRREHFTPAELKYLQTNAAP